MLYRDELESESFGFGPEFGFLPSLVLEMIGCKSGIIKLLPSGDQVEDDPGQPMCCGRDRFWGAESGAHTAVELAERGLAVVQRLRGHAQCSCGPAFHLPRASP